MFTYINILVFWFNSVIETIFIGRCVDFSVICGGLFPSPVPFRNVRRRLFIYGGSIGFWNFSLFRGRIILRFHILHFGTHLLRLLNLPSSKLIPSLLVLGFSWFLHSLHGLNSYPTSICHFDITKDQKILK